MESHKLYRRLKSDEIRLLVLLPAVFGKPIECELIHSAALCSTPRWYSYTALSYEWGLSTADPDQKKCILLDGQNLPVRDNLWHALQHLRSPSEELKIWIDAICINQEDDLERNHQVGLMKEIYSKAILVHVWLGKGTPQTCYAFGLLKRFWETSGCRIHEDVEELEYIAKKKKEACPYGDENNEIEELMIPQLDDVPQKDFAFRLESETEVSRRIVVPFYSGHENWSALASITDSTYWRRIWIVQEYLLARKTRVHCGSNSIDGVVFDGALTHVLNHIAEQLPEVHPITRRNVLLISKSPGFRLSNCRSYPKSRTLLELLGICKDSEACKPRDRLYALLGLAIDAPGDQRRYAMLIDYRSTDTTVKSTFAEAFKITHEMAPLLDYMLRDAELENFRLYIENSIGEMSVRMVCNSFDSTKEGQIRLNWRNGERAIIPENYTKMTYYNGEYWLILQCDHCGTPSKGDISVHQTGTLSSIFECLHCYKSTTIYILAEDCCCESCNCERQRAKRAEDLKDWEKFINREHWHRSAIPTVNRNISFHRFLIKQERKTARRNGIRKAR